MLRDLPRCSWAPLVNEAEMSRLTVVIPTYNRPAYLAECLESIAAQTYRDFRLVVLDNASTEPYGPVIERFAPLGIEYIRNAENIGAVRNIDKAREVGSDSEYHLIFHDDDLMHPEMLGQQIAALDQRPELAWIATECAPFGANSPRLECWDASSGIVEIYETPDALVRRLLQNVSLNFGSVMYRTSASAAIHFKLAEFEIIADRVFLCDIAETSPVAMIPAPMVRYRHHAAQDSHNPVFREVHALALMRYYQSHLPQPLSADDLRLLQRHSTNYLLHARSTIAPEDRVRFRDLTRKAKADGLFRWSAVDGQGVAALAGLAGAGGAYARLRPTLGAIKRLLRGQ